MENQVNVVRQLLEYIFDRNAALLPGKESLKYNTGTIPSISRENEKLPEKNFSREKRVDKTRKR